jgi:hypothetical protein
VRGGLARGRLGAATASAAAGHALVRVAAVAGLGRVSTSAVTDLTATPETSDQACACACAMLHGVVHACPKRHCARGRSAEESRSGSGSGSAQPAQVRSPLPATASRRVVQPRPATKGTCTCNAQLARSVRSPVWQGLSSSSSSSRQ